MSYTIIHFHFITSLLPHFFLIDSKILIISFISNFMLHFQLATVKALLLLTFTIHLKINNIHIQYVHLVSKF